MKDIHIGKEIERVLTERRMTKVDFARRMGIAQQNVNRILDSKHTTTDKLQRISEILHFDFFSLYQDGKGGNSATAIGDNPIAAINSEVMSSDCSVLQERIRYLEQILREKERMIQYLMKDVQRDIKN